MTMLDTMRRHRGWLKWLLGLIVLAFIFFYVPDFIRGGDPSSLNAAVAEVEGAPITAREYQRQLTARIQMFRNSGGGNISEAMLRQLGIDRQVLQSLIEQRATEAEARRNGLKVSDAEVREFIMNFPNLQENGQFVGYERYRMALRNLRPPLTEAEFEEAVRRDLLAEKLQAAVTSWVTVSDAEVDEENRRRNEKVKLEAVAFSADAYRTGLTATDEEVSAAFGKNQEKYRIGERRKIRYVLVDTQALRATITPTAQEIERAYNSNIEQYSNPEQVSVAHILLKTEGKDEGEVRKKAEGILAEAKKPGADFAALATKYSEDEGSKARGGVYDFFGRGAMVKPFEDVAFTLENGQISDLVKTDFGFHIIKGLAKRPAGVRPLTDVRDQLVEQLKSERAQERAGTLSTQLAAEIAKPADLDAAAKKNGLAVKESPFFQRTDPIGELGPSAQIASSAFSLKDDQVSEAIRVPQGFAFIAVSGKEASRLPKLDEVKERVRLDVIGDKAKAAAQAKAAELAAAVKGGATMAAAAKAEGREVRTTEAIARGTVIPDVGVSPAVDKAAFALPVGGVSDPIATDSGAAVIRVVEKTAVSDADLASGRDALRKELVSVRRNRFFSSYMARAREKLDIRTYPQALARVSGN